MALTYAKYTADGETLKFPITFPYFDSDHVMAEVGSKKGNYTVNTVSNEVIFQVAPSEGLIVTVRRVTPRDRPYSDFTRGNRFGEKNVNNSFLWQLYISQEIADGGISDESSRFTDLDMQGFRVTNLGKPVDKNDAVRLVDLMGGEANTTGITFFSGDTYTELPVLVEMVTPTTFSFSFDVKFNNTLNDRTLMTAKDGTYASLSASLKTLYMKPTVDSQPLSLAIDDIGLPIGKRIVFTVEVTRIEEEVYSLSLLYDGKVTQESIEFSSFAFDRLFGGGSKNLGGALTCYKHQLRVGDFVLNWSYYNLYDAVVPCSNSEFNGLIKGENYAPADPDEGDEDSGTNLRIEASAVNFNPTGTNYNPQNRTVDKVLKEIDSQFYRKTGAELDPDPADPNTPIQPNSVWVANTSNGARSRPLPKEDEMPIGATVLVRDGSGKAKTNNISIMNNGQTIMGKYDYLVINEDWAWVELVYLGEGAWVITSGGVGSQLEPDKVAIIEAVYPVGSIYISSDSVNPNIKFGVGTWVSTAVGRAIAGAGTSTDANGTTATLEAGRFYGNWTHRLEPSHLPEHQHIQGFGEGYNTAKFGLSGEKVTMTVPDLKHTGSFSLPLTSKAGSARPTPLGVMQPTQGFYVWERTA